MCELLNVSFADFVASDQSEEGSYLKPTELHLD